MISPARAHKLTEAAKQSALEQVENSVIPSDYALALAQMAQHKRQLANIQSSQLKRDKKKALWVEWQSYVEGALQNQNPAPDTILAQLMVWAFDAEQTQAGVDIGTFMVRHNLPQPVGFNRDTPSLLAEIAADCWLQNGTGQAPTIDHQQLMQVWQAVENEDIFDISRAKLLRALAESAITKANEEDKHEAEQLALSYLDEAVKTWSNVGGKPLLRQLRKKYNPKT